MSASGVLASTAQASQIPAGPIAVTVDSPGCSAPPAALRAHPEMATVADMAQYGLPPRPALADKKGMARWDDVVKHSIHRVCGFTPFPKGVKPSTNGIDATQRPSGASIVLKNDPLFSGYVAFTPSGFTLNEAWGHFHAPCINGWASAPAHSSHWVGIGGQTGSNPTILQAGTASKDNGNHTTTYYGWVEEFSAIDHRSEHQVLPGVHCGDLMFSDVWEPNLAYLDDVTQNVYWSNVVEQGFSATTTTWECISEWTDRFDGYLLANYNYATYTGCDGHDWANGLTYNMQPDTYNPTKYETTDNGGFITQYPGNLNSSGDGFTSYWQFFS
jgi:hypothetical protein